MYSMDLDKLPRRAVVPSQLSAEAEFKAWLRENCFDRMKDKDGLEWQVSATMEIENASAGQVPGGQNQTNAPHWVIRISLSAAVDGPTFCRTKTLNPEEDERLLAMLEGESIPLCMRPREFRISDEIEAQRILADELPRLRDDLRNSSLIELKRALIGRWVDSRHTFSERY